VLTIKYSKLKAIISLAHGTFLSELFWLVFEVALSADFYIVVIFDTVTCIVVCYAGHQGTNLSGRRSKNERIRG